MTATGDFSKNFRDEPDTSDYTSPSFVFLLDGAQITSGLLNSIWAVGEGRHMAYEALLTYGAVRSAIVEKNSPSTGGGECGPSLIDTDGNGYELRAIYDELRLLRVTAAEPVLTLGVISFNYLINTNFEIQIDDDNNITAYANGALLGFDPIQDTTYPSNTLRPGWHSDRNDSGGGYQSGIYSFAADGVLSTAVINSLPEFLPVGETVEIETTGLGDLTTTTTISGKQIASADAPDGDGNITIASFVNGQTYPAMGLAEVIARDGTEESQPYSSSYLVTMPGWQYVDVSDMDTGPWSLGKAVTGDTVITQAHAIDDGTCVLNEDLTLSNWALGDYTAWLRDDDGVMYQLNFTVTQSGVTPTGNFDFVQKVQFVGFIQ